jgi:hypothetical protein
MLAVAVVLWRLRPPERREAQPRDRAAESESGQRVLSLGAATRETKSGTIVRLLWDPSAAPVRQSSYATLFVYDGGSPKKFVLSRRELDAGYMDYSPVGEQVTFHLMFEKGRTQGEYMLVLLAAGGSETGSLFGLPRKEGR